METEKILGNLVRIGTVTVVDAGKRLARVKYQDSGITSWWLPVLAAPPSIPEHEPVSPWMPKINDTVLTLYLPVFNGDGFILGRI